MSNVLVYSGPGVSSSALSHTLRTLRLLLPSYDVQCINAQSLAQDPWMDTTSLLVIPGGRDLPYVEKLSFTYRKIAASGGSSSSSRADQKIKEYIQEKGGNFLGICAGAYFASARCEFEEGDAIMQVVGDRPALQFYPATCRGTVFPGFVYESDEGARMVDLQCGAISDGRKWSTYYNGGGAFIDAERYEKKGVEVLARYLEEDEAEAQSKSENAIKAGFAGQAAVVRCKVGKGMALLYGTHPEFPVLSESRPTQLSGAPEALPTDRLEALEVQRMKAFGEHLSTLGLHVKPFTSEVEGSAESGPPKLTPILLSAKHPGLIRETLQDLQTASSTSKTSMSSFLREGEKASLLSFADSNDTLHFYNGTSTRELFEACQQADYSSYTSPVVAPSSDEARAGEVNEVEVDLNKVPKYFAIVMQDNDIDLALTPHWDATTFYAFAEESRRRIDQGPQESWVTGSISNGPNWKSSSSSNTRLADVTTYAQVTTSTQTILDKNYKLLTRLPTGFTSFATHQMSGRGRGKNAWISPLGCLQFSTLLHVSPISLSKSGAGGVVFVQYLAGLAIVESVRSGILGAEYRTIGEKIRIKWPNDVYAEVGDADDGEGERKGTFTYQGKRLAKMAGVLVNSQFVGKQMSLVVGCGINTLNKRPTTSLSDLIEAHNASLSNDSEKVPVVSQERLAGAILSTLERMWNTFVNAGGSFDPFIDAYRRAWLHSDQMTMLSDTNPPTPVKIVGITSDFGLLRCTPAVLESRVDSYSRGAWSSSKEPGQWIDLQPDGNSFDMLANLIRRKE